MNRSISEKKPGYPVYSNLHTHTKYCDGSATAEDMVKKAIELDFCSLGFSGHSYTAFDESYCMSQAGIVAYGREIQELQQRYAGQLDILLGLEQDFFSQPPEQSYDFLIGSVHYVQAGGAYIPIDTDAALMEEAVARYFNGDYYAYAEAYYQLAAEVPRRTGADIIGHFDLISKFNEGGRYFDESAPRYRQAALEALADAARAEKPFEINTGAMFRGLRRAPYPAAFLLRRLAELGGRIVLSSDSHSVDALGYQFAAAAELAKSCGFNSALILKRQGWAEVEL